MKVLAELVLSHENWLMQRVLYYAKEHGYTKYTSTLAEAWRTSIAGLSEALIQGLQAHEDPPEFGPDEDFTKDPIASFGILEAQRHRARGVRLGMFLGLMKYYRQSYIDLVLERCFDRDTEERNRKYVERFFDRVELGFTVEWVERSQSDLVEELQETNRAMTNEKNRYLTIFESLTNPVILLNLHNEIENMNHAALFLFSDQETPGSYYYAAEQGIEPLAWLSGELADFRVTDRTEMSFEKDLDTPGGVRHFQVKLARMLDVSGKFSGSIVVLNDMTEQIQAQSELQSSEQRLDLALQGGDLILWDMDVQTGKVVWNEHALEILGRLPREMVVHSTSGNSLVHPEDWPRVSETLDRHLRGAIPRFEAEYRIQAGSGEWKWILSRGKTAKYDKDGRPLRIIGTSLDITDRKGVEAELQRSEAQKAAILNGISSNIAFVNEKLEILWANKASADSVRRSPAELVGRKCHEWWAKPEGPCEGCPTVKAFRSRKSEQATTVTPDGRIWDERGEPVFGEDGRLIGVVEIAQDITDQVRAEKEKEKLRSELLQAQKMKAVGTLTGGIAHDFNNMLTVILGYSELLLADTEEGTPQREDLEKIVQTSRNGADLVQRLLTFSRQAEAQPRNMNLNDRIRQIHKLLSKTIPKMIEIDLVLADDLAPIHADPSQMEQIVMNLAVNASEAMPDTGKLTIRTKNMILDDEFCRIRHGVKPGTYVLLRVSDTGRGIDKETMDRMFDPFFTTKGWDSRRGTGLGLPIVQGVVEQHKGYIECFTELGKGTTFDIYLPAIKEGDEPTKASGKALLPAGTETVLFVDDEEDIRELGKRYLSRAGYTVLLARNGTDALEIYKSRQDDISLVVLDLVMPETSGRQCLAQILKMNPRMKVLIASGRSSGGTEQDAMEIGAKGFVRKPFDMKQLLQAVRDVLDAH
jgi:two-component system, cell cycle sensor histidine kinase and response regulator CckA